MKHLYSTLIGGISLLVGLASCEMKNELTGEKGTSDEKGLLEIGVSYNDKVNIVPTKADTDIQDANGFKVDITGTNYNETFTYEAGKAISVELPIGVYSVYAHSDLEKEVEMDVPYYGKQESLEIKTGQTVSKEIVCKMENTKIQLQFDDKFQTDFSTCELTITAGSRIWNYTYTQANMQNPPAKYWILEEGVNEIIVNATGWTKEGNVKVTQSFTFSKDDHSDYVGSDAIIFNMTSSGSTTSGSAKISVTVSLFEETDGDVVEIPVEGEETTPDPVRGWEPTVSFPKETYTLPADTDANADATITSVGLQSVKVKIVAGNETFADIVSKMFPENPFELIGNTNLEGIFTSMGIPLPKADDTEYAFPVGNFFSLLSGMGETTGDGHVFEITVTDKNGTTSAALSVEVESTTTE